MLRHVDLCSGIGGFALGFEWAGLSKPVLFCDIDDWCRKVLQKHWADVPIEKDVKELANDPTRIPDCDILTAGYPCQPFSVAGKQKGTEDDRHIWSHLRTIVAHKRPTWCVFENVYGHIALGLDQVLLDLETEGYATRTFIVPAASVNAPHKRERVWIIAHANSESEPVSTMYAKQGQGKLVGDAQHNGSPTTTVGRSTQEASNDNQTGQIRTSKSSRTSEPRDGAQVEGSTDVPDTNAQRLQGDVGQGQTGTQGQSGRHASKRSAGVSESRLGRMVDGIPDWLDEPDGVPRVAVGMKDRTNRLKGLGNALIPHIAMQIGLTIRGINEQQQT